ncbi:ATP-binding protein [Paenibacillus jilunlii]|uniref:ATPase family associated with various cellular activities (AAA) n=2 Tax=Paenibacillus TaxID=44249 RepID=A0A1G9NRJ8_9BACL|nr:ATP-binding protein [Paenibacillus jilunlii]SDL88615.1 ATPase family associated with various cellular activities (AAA) [Paenibacillus jilunlii]
MKFKKLARTFRQETPEAGCAEREAEPVLDPTPAHTLVSKTSPEQESSEPSQPYTSNYEHLAEELQLLDLRLKLRMLEAPQLDSELVLMNEEIRSLLNAESSEEDDKEHLTTKAGHLEQRIAARLEASSGQEVQLMLPQVADSLNLSGLEVSILVACLAPELDRKYERIYAFLQNDMSDQRPTAGFVLRLFTGSAEERLSARLLFDVNAPLMKLLLERRGEYGDSRIPLIARPLKLEDWTVNMLLGYEVLDERLAKVAGLSTLAIPPHARFPEELEQNLLRFVKHYGSGKERKAGSLLYCSGPDEEGKLSGIREVCGKLGLSLLVADMDKLLLSEADFSEMLRLLGRHTLLENAALCFTGFDSIVTEDDRHLLKRRLLMEMLEAYVPLTFILGEAQWRISFTGVQLNFMQIDFPIPDEAERKQTWATFGQEYRLSPQMDLADFSGSFRFTAGQIRAALAGGENIAVWNGSSGAEVSVSDLYQACYFQSSRKIQALATKIRAMYTWDMLVLPDEQLSQLREICRQVKYRPLVYGEWGFAGRLSLGRGLNILFSGPPGSGKTMAAEVIATELNLEIYKIDVSQIVSKYIGETEKNLSRIFDEAETSNAILFFDEADALFGKRSEVKDAHDRYANVEISYLLQKMEEYTGIVILATNLNQNLDDAFARRLHFKLEFPFPEKKQRGLIWRGMFPRGAPLDPDMDYDFMADKFILAGGNIKNIALNAAFYAAHEGCPIGMKQIMLAAKREYLKLGRTFLQSDYAPYHKLIEVK